MGSIYRLTNSAFERKGEETKEDPLKVFFLSVEGSDTEREYFNAVDINKNQLGIKAIVKIEVLGRSKSDTRSSPKHVINLLEEYLEIRKSPFSKIDEEISSSFSEHFSDEFVKAYVDNPKMIPKKSKSEFELAMRKLGYDLNYRKYLMQFNNDMDEFCIIIDRDSIPEHDLLESINHCEKENYHCFISNPCFEFWLLLHLSDVITEYKDNLDDIQKNIKISNRHTYVSKEVSKRAGHSKSGINFVKNYLENVDKAIKRSLDFETDINNLVDHTGTNIGNLITEMRK